MTSPLGPVTLRKLAALAAACTLALSAHAQTNWVGNTSTDFNAPANWSAGAPTTSLNAILTTPGSFGSSLSITADIQVGGGTSPTSNATLFDGAAFTLTGNSGTRQFTIGGQGVAFNTTNTITFDVARIRRNATNTFEFLGSSANVVINSEFSTNITAAADTITRVDFTGATGNNNTITFNGNITKFFGTAGSGAGLLNISSVGTGNRVVFNNAANTGFTGAVTVGNNAILQLGNGGSNGTLSGITSISLGNSNSRFVVNQTDTVTQGTEFSNAISGAGGFTQGGAGTVILNGTNSYTGTTVINAGTLLSTKNAALSTSASVAVNNAGSTLAVNFGGASDYDSAQVATLLAKTTFGSTSTAFAFDTTNAVAPVNYSTALTQSAGFTKLGTNTLILTGGNTYTGTTTISGGTLQLGNGGTTGSLSSSSTIVNNALLALNRNDTVTQGTDFASAISGTGGLTQAGSGNLILAAGNTYTGATTVSAGTLSLGASDSLANTSNLILSGGTLATNSFSDAVGTLSLLGNSIIDFTSGGSFAFANSAAATWTGGMTLSLTSGFVSGSSLRFGLDATGLTGTQLGQISATGFDSFSLDSSGYLVGAAAIPEPSTYAALAGLGALGLALIRRRRLAAQKTIQL